VKSGEIVLSDDKIEEVKRPPFINKSFVKSQGKTILVKMLVMKPGRNKVK
jgi:hypothetical protein